MAARQGDDRERRAGGRPGQGQRSNPARPDSRPRSTPERGGGRGAGHAGRGRNDQRQDRKPDSVAGPARAPAGGAGVTNSRNSGSQLPARSAPQLPEGLTAQDLDPGVRRELRGLPKELADIVGAYLVMTQRWLSEDPDEAYRYAYEARRRAARLAVVREACGLTAYAAARWSDALAELRAVRRMRGDDSYLPVIADCERGLGRPERAISMARSPEVAKLPQDMRVEMRIVESGARRDLGQHEAAIVALQGPELRASVPRQFTARLYYAYAEALLAAGRSDEAEEWLARASTADANGETDAAERLAELDELTFLDATGDNAAPADSADFRDNTENAGNPEGTGSTGKDTEASTPGHSSGRQYPG